jgi:hypothetical protein
MRAATAYDDYWCPAGEGSDAVAATAISGNDWLALLKVANGDWSIPASELACLLERKLIEVSAGLVRLTPTGYIALGLPV